eukprot:gene15635-17213_t
MYFLVAIGLFIVFFVNLTVINRNLFDKTSQGNPCIEPNCGRNTAQIEEFHCTRKKLILFYTKLFGSIPWPGFQTSERFNNWGGIPCEIQCCAITYNRKLIHKADVVIFHAFGLDMVKKSHLKELSSTRNPEQIWIYFIHECPHNAWPRPSNFNHFFNWTMNYRMDADISVKYNWEWGTWERITDTEIQTRKRDYSQGKDKLVYGMISHCGVIREKYIKKLQEYIPVDIYGKCSTRFHQTPKVCKRGSPACDKQKKRYKFFLAFENSFCHDYITEKFHKTLLDGDAVPVVLGGADYNNLAIGKSFINILDFETVEKFAEYLKYLDRNNAAYNEYYNWKNVYRLGKPKPWSCEVCRMINEKPLKTKVYHDLGNWYSVKNNCGTGIKRLRTILNNSKISGPYTDQYYKQ